MKTWIFLLLWSSIASADVLQTEIAGLDLARNAAESHLVFLMKDGLVAKLAPQDAQFLKDLQEGVKIHQYYEITLDDQRRILQLKRLEHPKVKRDVDEVFQFAPYEPTVLPNIREAQAIFNELNPYYNRRSECYNRAHVWAYEEFQRRNLHSMKVFLFFTASYIRDYNWHWWFHVAPYVIVNENGKLTEEVIDYRFFYGPVKMREWTNYFIIPDDECPAVKKYTDYSDHEWDRYCYLIKRPMYYWQPLDIEAADAGDEKTKFLQEDVNTAYWQGF